MPSLARFPRATNQILQDHYCTLFYMTVDLNVWTHKYHSQMVAAQCMYKRKDDGASGESICPVATVGEVF